MMELLDTPARPYAELLKLLQRQAEELSGPPQPEEALYSSERLEQYAERLARELRVGPKSKRGRSLRAELKNSSLDLERVYAPLAYAIQRKQVVTPPAEWFVDNFHIVESQLREIRRNLPDNYYYGLPQLAEGDLKNYPRVYALALAYLSHTDSQIQPMALGRFLSAFQRVSPLGIGELWALSLTLRIVLVQHLSVLALGIVETRDNIQKGDALADRLLSLSVAPGSSEKQVIQLLQKEFERPKDFNRSLLVQLIQRLRDQNPNIWPAIEWIEKRLASRGTDMQKIVRLEHHQQASNQVTIGNIIQSMRLLNSFDYRDFFEGVSLVDRELEKDPAVVYGKMDFETRDQYRHTVERIAKRSELTELEVARKAVAAANLARPGSPENHVGYFLIGPGKYRLEKECGYRKRVREGVRRMALDHPTFLYLGLVFLLTVGLLIPVAFFFSEPAMHPLVLLSFLVLAAFPASELALSAVNHYLTRFVRPSPLPRLNTEKGVPTKAITMVVIPTLLSSPRAVRSLVERLEIHALANPDASFRFALLTDWLDAPNEHREDDDALLALATQEIEALNERHWTPSGAQFFLFHRRRRWNAGENAWIGWERKRGKLDEFNELLGGSTHTTFIVHTAPAELLAQVKYVITLDSDTQMPRDAARKLLGTILHPLNQPQFDEDTGRVTRGYGILQPRISITTESAQATRFARLSSGNIGLDPYTTAVSDVYQDLFQEGSFTGKGLYVVDAFRRALENRVPENQVLSHDLFEGSFARTALVTDVELYDDYPADYDTFSKRQHRWTRGDWQILPWIYPWTRNAKGVREKNDLSLIARWKIFDNLRRSVVPAATLFWLLLAWTILPGSPLVWTSFILAVYLFPVYATVATGDWMRLRGNNWHGHFLGLYRETKIKVGQIALSLTFLAQQACTSLDGAARALWRMWVSKTKLLEWTTFAQSAAAQHRLKILDYGPVTAIAGAVAVVALRPTALPVAFPFLLAWGLNPLLKSWLRRPYFRSQPALTESQRADYRSYARATWHFFETFVTHADHWLAPDNYQEDPEPVVAHRTSPTNIGLQVLAAATAYDLAFLGKKETLLFLERTADSLSRMPTVHGHFLNWYDTLTLRPLEPRYVSTVDSGNLAGHLLVLYQFLTELPAHHHAPRALQKGLEDTIAQFEAACGQVRTRAQGKPLGRITPAQLQQSAQKLLAEVSQARVETKQDLSTLVDSVAPQIADLKDSLAALTIESGEDIALLRGLDGWLRAAERQVNELQSSDDSDRQEAARIKDRCRKLALRFREMALGMDFRFLYDESRKLFVIGYNVNDRRRDNSYYDLLASESRLGSFVAVAKGDVPQEHWFRLGRQMAPVKGGRALVAWTATMFEYLMPLLVMKRFDETLLEQTYNSVVQRQIEYGKQKDVPWGVSESGFNARDRQLNYQYGPFGIPGLGLKRGLSDDLVISPYSTALAAMVRPLDSLANLKTLSAMGALGPFGFYEALDFTIERLPRGEKFVILRSFMAHHQGMSLVSFGNLLLGNQMQRRFHSDPAVMATELLLQERMPQVVLVSPIRSEEIRNSGFLHSAQTNPRLYSDVNLSSPRVQLLSNGSYTVMLSSTGAGYSRCGPIAVSRWREDATCDAWGHFYYLRKRGDAEHWSATQQPTGRQPKQFGTTFAEEKVDFWRRDEGTLTRTEVLVSPEDDVELRRISVSNESDETIEIEMTSFFELVIAKPADDAAHPSFSNLFVQTEFLTNGSALLGTRRPRTKKEVPPWAFHVAAVDGLVVSPVQFETDRSRFIGRGRDAFFPEVIEEQRPLSNTLGSVLDPIFSLRQTIRIAPGETGTVTFATGVAYSRERAVELVDKYRQPLIFKRESEIAWTQAQVQLRHLNINNAKAHTFQKLAGRLLFLDQALRPAAHILAQNVKAQSALWAYGISGDVPILLTRIEDEKDVAMVRELLHAHEYLRLKGLTIDLVILNERPSSYLQSLQDELQRQIRTSGSQALMDKPGGVFLRRVDIMPKEDVTLLRSVARVTLNADRGSLEQQLKYRQPVAELPPEKVVTEEPVYRRSAPASAESPRLQYFNGLGGFENNEYVIQLKGNQWTPAPWINVLANERDFGCVVSESGAGYTFSANSRENRLTPWSNDAVSDPPGEVIYLRDEETGVFWTPTPLPMRGEADYTIRHGQGITTFSHESHGLEQKLEIFVAMGDEIKFSRITLKNTGDTARKISVTAYVEWVLGFQRSGSAPYIIPEYDAVSGAIFARNPYNNEFSGRVAFAHMTEKTSHTSDRREFIGRNGSLRAPAAMSREALSNEVGAGMDPCAAFQKVVEIPAGESRTLTFLLGQTKDKESAQELVRKYDNAEHVEAALRKVRAYWEATTSALTVRTPDTAMNTLVNGWLVYQTLACRIWARSAFYQSGGAFGFRDQLQDVMAVVYSRPSITRAQLLTAAARQFPEGDVQHWWHPPSGRGVRTHFSDDLLWLPFVTAHYVRVTGDTDVLKELIPFIEAPLLAPGQEDSYTHPEISKQTATLLDHCMRTLEKSLAVGVHGLPLMGAGDWNDGMNRVGHDGKGESVWVAWFLSSVIDGFLPLLEKAGEHAFVEKLQEHQHQLKDAVEANAWDGDWYRRAYFDDGTPLGSASNDECRIDSISQSWAVLSKLGDRDRSRRAMAAVDQHLIRRGDGLIQLFTPPFDKTTHDPGYIKGYVPGVRENGGQYTHAAIWTLMAYAALGDGDKATELYSLLNPINHASTRAGLHKYKVEPYVVAADVYGMSPHVGRGGWTWYTGSASWMYRAAVESILGFEVQGERFRMNPRVPRSWEEFSLDYKFRTSLYRISVVRTLSSGHEHTVEVDGVGSDDEWVPFVDDGKEHSVKVWLRR